MLWGVTLGTNNRRRCSKQWPWNNLIPCCSKCPANSCTPNSSILTTLRIDKIKFSATKTFRESTKRLLTKRSVRRVPSICLVFIRTISHSNRATSSPTSDKNIWKCTLGIRVIGTTSKTTFSISWTKNSAWLQKRCRFWKLRGRLGMALLRRQESQQGSKLIKPLRSRMSKSPQATTSSHPPDLSLRNSLLRHLSTRSKICNFGTRLSPFLRREPSTKRTNSSKASPGIRRGTIFIALLLQKWALTNKNFSTNMRIRFQAHQIWHPTKRIKRRGRCRWKLISISRRNRLTRIRYCRRKWSHPSERQPYKIKSTLTTSVLTGEGWLRSTWYPGTKWSKKTRRPLWSLWPKRGWRVVRGRLLGCPRPLPDNTPRNQGSKGRPPGFRRSRLRLICQDSSKSATRASAAKTTESILDLYLTLRIPWSPNLWGIRLQYPEPCRVKPSHRVHSLNRVRLKVLLIWDSHKTLASKAKNR